MTIATHNKDNPKLEARFGASGLSFIPASDSAIAGWGPGDSGSPSWVDPLGIPNTEPNTSILSGLWEAPRLRRRIDVKTHDPYNNHGRVTLEPSPEYGGGYAIVAQYDSYGTPTKSILRRKGVVIGSTRGGEFVTFMEFVKVGENVGLWVLTTDAWRTKLWSYVIQYNSTEPIDDSAWSPVGVYDTASLPSITGTYPVGKDGNYAHYTMKRRVTVPTTNTAKNKVCVSFYAVPDKYIMWIANNLNDLGYPSPTDWRFKNLVGSTQEDPQAQLYVQLRSTPNWGGYLVFDSRELTSPTVHWHPILSLPNLASSYNFNVVFDAYFDGEDVRECIANVKASTNGMSIDEEATNPSSRPSTFPTTESWVWHRHSISGGKVNHLEVTYNFGFATLRSFFSAACLGASATDQLKYKNWTTFSDNAADDVIDEGQTTLQVVAADVVEMINEHRIYYYNLKDKIIAHGRHDWVGTRNYTSTNVHTVAIYTSDMFITTDKITRKVTNKLGYDWHAKVDENPMRTEGANPDDDVNTILSLGGLPYPYIYREPILQKPYTVFDYEYTKYGSHVQQWLNYDKYKGEVSFSVEETYGGRVYGSYADLPSYQRLYTYFTPPYLPPFFGHNWRYQNSFLMTDIYKLTGVVGTNPRFYGICLY